jgi:uncharacterized protein
MIRDVDSKGKVILRPSWLDVQQAVHSLAESIRELRKQLPEKDFHPRYIVPIARGGLIPAGILAYILDMPVKGGIRVNTYHPHTGRSILKPDTPLADDSEILFVDDIVDSGSTAETVHYNYPNAHLVTPFGKQTGFAKAYAHTWFPASIRNEYIFKDSDWVEFPWDSNQVLAAITQARHK